MARLLSLGLDDGLALVLVLFGAAAAVAADDAPRPTPVTRPAATGATAVSELVIPE